MELKEAKEQLKKLIAWYYQGNKSTTIDPEEYEAIVMIFEELDRLQKENEGIKARIDKYIQGGNETLKLQHEETLKYYHENYISKDKIRELISKIDADIETNDRRMIMYEEEKGTSKYVCRLIAYDPRSLKIILQELLKEE